MSRIRAAAAVLAAIAILVAGCSTPAATSAPSPSATPLGPRPSSLATVSIVEPADGATVVGTDAHVVLKLTGAKIVTQATTSIRPDEGHVHLYVDNQLVSMNYGLEQDIPVTPGSHVLRVEFVAADHAPFNPRVASGNVVFTVN